MLAGHVVDRHGCAGRRRQAGHGGVDAVEQLGPQPAPGVDAQRVEDEPVVAAAGRRDLDLGQAEQPVVDPRREVDGAHLVEPRGRRLLGEQAPPQLDLAVGDAVAGGQPTQDAEGDDERDGDAAPTASLPSEPDRKMTTASSAGRKRISVSSGWTSSIRASSRRQPSVSSLTWRRPSRPRLPP